MNCADSVLNSDELPVRGIDQCPSTLSTQWNPGLVSVKWNRLLALFRRAWLNSCFVEAEAFLKCVNLLWLKRVLFFLCSFREFGAAHFVSILLFAALELVCFDLKVKALSSSSHWLLNLQKRPNKKQHLCASVSTKILMASHKASNSSTNILEVCGVEASGPRLTFKWLLPSEGGLGQLVYTVHSFRPLRTTGTDHWASMAAPTGTDDSQLPPALPLKLTGRLITGGSSQQTTAVKCSQCGNKWV